ARLRAPPSLVWIVGDHISSVGVTPTACTRTSISTVPSSGCGSDIGTKAGLLPVLLTDIALIGHLKSQDYPGNALNPLSCGTRLFVRVPRLNNFFLPRTREFTSPR